MSEEKQVPTIEQTIGAAIEHHSSGRLAQAESIYQQILRIDVLRLKHFDQ